MRDYRLEQAWRRLIEAVVAEQRARSNQPQPASAVLDWTTGRKQGERWTEMPGWFAVMYDAMGRQTGREHYGLGSYTTADMNNAIRKFRRRHPGVPISVCARGQLFAAACRTGFTVYC
jgi:hypothetical protein